MKDPANPHTFWSMCHLHDWIIQNSVITYLITGAILTAKLFFTMTAAGGLIFLCCPCSNLVLAVDFHLVLNQLFTLIS